VVFLVVFHRIQSLAFKNDENESFVLKSTSGSHLSGGWNWFYIEFTRVVAVPLRVQWDSEFRSFAVMRSFGSGGA
jgi:hypothetical protein